MNGNQPQWLIDTAARAYADLIALPSTSQPTWFRIHYGDLRHLLAKKD